MYMKSVSSNEKILCPRARDYSFISVAICLRDIPETRPESGNML